MSNTLPISRTRLLEYISTINFSFQNFDPYDPCTVCCVPLSVHFICVGLDCQCRTKTTPGDIFYCIDDITFQSHMQTLIHCIYIHTYTHTCTHILAHHTHTRAHTHIYLPGILKQHTHIHIMYVHTTHTLHTHPGHTHHIHI